MTQKRSYPTVYEHVFIVFAQYAAVKIPACLFASFSRVCSRGAGGPGRQGDLTDATRLSHVHTLPVIVRPSCTHNLMGDVISLIFLFLVINEFF